VNQTYVLDANAVLNLVEASPGFEKVQQVLENALQSQSLLLISVLNWGEVLYVLWQRRGEEKARQTMTSLSRLPLEIVSVDLSQALQAGEIKARHKIPYVDCIAAALAMLHRATLVTSDRDFEKLGRHFPIQWISRV
jgi:predicted nucleic acid-binding protein